MVVVCVSMCVFLSLSLSGCEQLIYMQPHHRTVCISPVDETRYV